MAINLLFNQYLLDKDYSIHSASKRQKLNNNNEHIYKYMEVKSLTQINLKYTAFGKWDYLDYSKYKKVRKINLNYLKSLVNLSEIYFDIPNNEKELTIERKELFEIVRKLNNRKIPKIIIKNSIENNSNLIRVLELEISEILFFIN